jgi:hypothetical protein
MYVCICMCWQLGLLNDRAELVREHIRALELQYSDMYMSWAHATREGSSNTLASPSRHRVLTLPSNTARNIANQNNNNNNDNKNSDHSNDQPQSLPQSRGDTSDTGSPSNTISDITAEGSNNGAVSASITRPPDGWSSTDGGKSMINGASAVNHVSMNRRASLDTNVSSRSLSSATTSYGMQRFRYPSGVAAHSLAPLAAGMTNSYRNDTTASGMAYDAFDDTRWVNGTAAGQWEAKQHLSYHPSLPLSPNNNTTNGGRTGAVLHSVTSPRNTRNRPSATSSSISGPLSNQQLTSSAQSASLRPGLTYPTSTTAPTLAASTIHWSTGR